MHSKKPSAKQCCMMLRNMNCEFRCVDPTSRRIIQYDYRFSSRNVVSSSKHVSSSPLALFVRPVFRALFGVSHRSVVGVLLGFILIQPYDMQEMHAHLLLLMQDYDISLRLPEIDFSCVEVEWDRLRSNIPEVWKLNNDGREFQVGEAMKERGLTAQYPVVVIPGIISTVRDPVLMDSMDLAQTDL